MSEFSKRSIEERVAALHDAVFLTCEALEQSRRTFISYMDAMTGMPQFDKAEFERRMRGFAKQHGAIAGGVHRFTTMALESLERSRE